jgi:hypothetical protein
MSGFGIDIFDQSLTRKGKKDTKHIQLLKVALNELHSLLMDRKDYPIGAYIHACSTTTNTQIENFNKFIGYLDELETPVLICWLFGNFLVILFLKSRLIVQHTFLFTNTQIENFNKFIGYLDELETKQKFKSVSYPADFLRKYLDSLILNLNFLVILFLKSRLIAQHTFLFLLLN